MQQYFKTTPPTVHQMVITLEKRELITREPGKPRSIRLLIPHDQLPDLD
jgi:repressor LexA